MEFKLVNENKLKIILTDEDMAEMNITYDDMNQEKYDSDENTRRVVREILNEAKWRTGFDANPGGILIQVPERKNDGCLLFVTKTCAQKQPAYARTYKKLYTSIKKKRLIYMFESSETLHEACRQLMLAGYNGKSDIFAGDGRYYLYIEDNREQCLELLSEYGLFINNPYFSFRLDEHAEKILSADAVQTFAEIF